MAAWRAIRGALLTVALGWSLSAAAEPVAVPPLSAHIVDQTATLSREQTATLEQTLQAFEASKGSQLAVLIVPTTGEETIEQYGLRVVEQWKLGRKNVDDGALLLVAKDDRTLRIEVGYGLEGALTDATSKRIISEIIVPRFRQGDFYGGISAGVERIIGVINGEPLPPPKRSTSSGWSGLSQFVPVIFVLVFVVGGLLRLLLGRLPAAVLTGSGVAVLAWVLLGALTVAMLAGLMAFFFTLVGGMGGRGGWHSGGGWSGGRGGGGFGSGGFSGGGGGFGGGGASGRW
ncbi:YgcG family protein [Pseudogulbenkiania sp. MAI-1]|uniref:TPM domain-containing protein n=1 Tax=Pseudogulbenkiania sp. MAI-1 TaxID=990370 RepID=UPI00045E8656|nr:YgcG family protein [Pseudogulbenkiania sp. MAI-1]